MDKTFESASELLTLARSQHADARDYEAAKAHYLEAAEIAEQLPKDDFDSQMLLAEIYEAFEEELCGKLGLAYDPDVQIAEDPDYLMAVAAAFKNLGQRSGNDEERRHYKLALDVAGRLPKDNPDCQEFLAWLCTYLGNVRYKPKDHYRRAIEIREQMPQTPENLHALAELYNSLAFVHSIDKEAEESALCKRKSAEYRSRLNEGEINE